MEPLELSPTNSTVLQAWQGVGKGALCPLFLNCRLNVYQCITYHRYCTCKIITKCFPSISPFSSSGLCTIELSWREVSWERLPSNNTCPPSCSRGCSPKGWTQCWDNYCVSSYISCIEQTHQTKCSNDWRSIPYWKGQHLLWNTYNKCIGLNIRTLVSDVEVHSQSKSLWTGKRAYNTHTLQNANLYVNGSTEVLNTYLWNFICTSFKKVLLSMKDVPLESYSTDIAFWMLYR